MNAQGSCQSSPVSLQITTTVKSALINSGNAAMPHEPSNWRGLPAWALFYRGSGTFRILITIAVIYMVYKIFMS
jgi:hypothetical protein